MSEIDLSQLPAPLVVVPLDFGAGAFEGAARWLEIGVRVNGAAQAHTLLGFADHPEAIALPIEQRQHIGTSLLTIVHGPRQFLAAVFLLLAQVAL